MTPVDELQAEFCRAVEAYLCRKNEGHLVRIVGPAFEQVCGWARRGVPLGIAQTGIDRYVERYNAKGPRRRPVRIEFCEADILDAFEEWRRSVLPAVTPEAEAGVDVSAAGGTASSPGADVSRPPAPSAGRRSPSLSSHLERVIARLSVLRAGATPAFGTAVDAIVRELDAARAGTRTVRGESRQALLDRLQALDASLVVSAAEQLGPAGMTELRQRAEEDLAPYRNRLGAAAFAEARQRAVDRLVRERLGLPAIALD